MVKLLLLLSEPASEFGRKCFKLDSISLESVFEVTALSGEPDVSEAMIGAVDFVQAYGNVSRSLLKKAKGRLVVADASSKVARSRWFSPPEPRARIEATEGSPIPEPVAAEFFPERRPARVPGEIREVGVFNGRRDLNTILELCGTRVARVRDDIGWRIFDTPPSVDELRECDLWCDPATSPDDLDGFVAEAAAAGVPVVASRIPVNEWRLDHGLAGLLVPPTDPNEMAHAVLSALFKPELNEARIEHSWSSRDRFAVERRVAGWISFYRKLAA